jgi:hypothetical protein
MQGYHVDTHGLRLKKEDQGVDHILIKSGQISLVQAKAISKSSKLSKFDIEVIHSRLKDFWEKNRNNTDLLPGELGQIMLVVANQESLPQETQDQARELGLILQIVPYEDRWPEVKCVISGKGDKRFYLPKDQHWIGCNMLADKRRFWVHSAEEAQARGFSSSKVKKE